jgi:hypothetical protein
MVLLTFEGIIYVVSGNLETRLNNLMNILIVSDIYNTDFRIIWRITNSFRLQLSDIFHDDRFRGKLLNDKVAQELMKTDSYYYNPKMSVEEILSRTIPLGKQVDKRRFDIDIKHFKWLVVDNLNGKRICMIPSGILKAKDHKEKMTHMYESLKLNTMIEGYINMFINLTKEHDLYSVYIHQNNDIEQYKNLIHEMNNVYGNGKPIKVFVAFSSLKFDIKSSKEWTKELTEEFGDDNVICLKIADHNEQLANIINFICLRKIEKIHCIGHIDPYLHEIYQSANNIVTMKKSKLDMNNNNHAPISI